MDQDLNAAVSHNAQRMAAVGGLGDLAAGRGKDLALAGVNAAAGAQNTLCKHLIGDVLHRYKGALGISSQHHGEGRLRRCGRCGRFLQKIKKSHRSFSPS